MTKLTTVVETVKEVAHTCAACLRRINPEYAVETDEGLKHQACFRRGI